MEDTLHGPDKSPYYVPRDDEESRRTVVSWLRGRLPDVKRFLSGIPSKCADPDGNQLLGPWVELLRELNNDPSLYATRNEYLQKTVDAWQAKYAGGMGRSEADVPSAPACALRPPGVEAIQSETLAAEFLSCGVITRDQLAEVFEHRGTKTGPDLFRDLVKLALEPGGSDKLSPEGMLIFKAYREWASGRQPGDGRDPSAAGNAELPPPARELKPPGSERRLTARPADAPSTSGEITEVALAQIVPNPFFPVERYPLVKEKVQALMISQKDVGFEGVLPARRRGDNYEVAYGRHRLEACTRLHGPEHKVRLAVRERSDEEMLRLALWENRDEWNTTFYTEMQQVRAVVQAFSEGKIALHPVPAKTNRTDIRVAPSFVPGCVTDSVPHPKSYTVSTVAKFLGWASPSGVGGKLRVQDRARAVFTALELVETGALREDDLRDLGHAESIARVKEVQGPTTPAKPKRPKASTTAGDSSKPEERGSAERTQTTEGETSSERTATEKASTDADSPDVNSPGGDPKLPESPTEPEASGAERPEDSPSSNNRAADAGKNELLDVARVTGTVCTSLDEILQLEGEGEKPGLKNLRLLLALQNRLPAERRSEITHSLARLQERVRTWEDRFKSLSTETPRGKRKVAA